MKILIPGLLFRRDLRDYHRINRMTRINTNLSIIILNIKGLSSLMKRLRPTDFHVFDASRTYTSPPKMVTMLGQKAR